MKVNACAPDQRVLRLGNAGAAGKRHLPAAPASPRRISLRAALAGDPAQYSATWRPVEDRHGDVARHGPVVLRRPTAVAQPRRSTALACSRWADSTGPTWSGPESSLRSLLDLVSTDSLNSLSGSTTVLAAGGRSHATYPRPVPSGSSTCQPLISCRSVAGSAPRFAYAAGPESKWAGFLPGQGIVRWT
jgi:hypothetical protein